MAINGNTGFRVSYTVRATPDKGRGVFADAPIRKGTHTNEMVVENQHVQSVTTHMNAYVETLYGLGVETVNVAGIECVSVGLTDSSREYLVVDELSKSYPTIDFWRRDAGCLAILERVYAAFLEQQNLSPGVV